MMCWGGFFLADSPCTALISFTIAPFDQSLVTTCSEGRGEEVPTQIASVLLDAGLEETVWVQLAHLKFRKEEEGAVLLFGPFFGGGDGTVMAGPFFAAAAEVATEDFFRTHSVSFLGAFFVGIVSLVSFLDGTVLLV
jgi:hypothetical protein